MTFQSYEVLKIILLTIITVCTIIITIKIVKIASKLDHNRFEGTNHNDYAPFEESTTENNHSNRSVADQLLEIKALRENGTISEEQFQFLKKEILSQ